MDIHGFLKTHQLPSTYADTAQKWFIPLCERLVKHQESAENSSKAPLVVGINGCQGSGKSTLTDFISAYLTSIYAKKVVCLSIDDFYLDKSQRNALSIKVHPLLATRGVPGTHNMPLALSTFKQLKGSDQVALPRFNKAIDDPFPVNQWPVISAPPDIIILEGWCVGVTPQNAADMKQPINSLEENQDPLGIWRSFVNTELSNDYQSLFDQIDYRVMLKAPSFECVYRWRLEQEHKLAVATQGASTGVMSDEQVAQFIQNYQRLTEHALKTLPTKCDTVYSLDETRTITGEEVK
ncbi:kinase [Alteromonas stellipolaris]|jgi:D-glycerate 3-kinase|uniref:kinase n=1 Tax=Alteromonas TaxID=226 RepID=UPI0007701BDA|nr:kinase [Alteromonas stellipolaris]AMJ93893.1 kinase [Alteromonas stellipolaris]